MDRKKIAVLGGSFLQTDFVETALANDIDVFVLDGNKDCYISRWDSVHFYPINFADENQVLIFCKEHEIGFVYAPCNEAGNLISSRLAPTLGFRYNPEEVVKITLDKSLQREKATLCNSLFSPKCLRYSGSIVEIESMLSYPMVIKPSSSSAGRGITGVNSRAELEQALKVAELYIGPHGHILVEEYIGGDQISVETISAGGKHHIAGITLEIVGPAPLFIERNHYMNRDVHERFLPLVQESVNELLMQIGIQYGPCHIEMKVDAGRVSLIEIASRSGGLRDRLMKLAGYADYNEMILDAYLNEHIDTENLHAPGRHGLVNILTKVEDLNSVVLGKRDTCLHSLYLNEKGPVYQPQNIIDAYGYAYFTSQYALNEYSLEHY